MRRSSDRLLACALLGVASVACSSNDSDTPSTNTAANQPGAMNAGNAAGSSGANPGISPAGEAGAGGSEATSPPGGGEMPGPVGLNPGAGGTGNPSGGGMNNAAAGAGNAGAPASGGAGPNGAAGAGAGGNPPVGGPPELGIFVATASDSGGDLGGLAGADATCETLAAQVGAGGRSWRAYLSTSTVDARDRIGDGPWVNANGVVVATDLNDLHSLTAARGTPLVDLFLDQAGNRINGQWAGSPGPNQHDMLTGSAPDGTALAATCNDWTSATATPGPQVGHSDGLGPNMNGAGNFGSWNSSHAPQGCSQQQLVQVGGAGRFYCFAAD